MKLITLLLTAAAFTAGCGLYTACKNDCPSQPPVLPPGHTALALQPAQVSTRWATLAWKNDSTAVSRAYVLLRNGKDTIYNAAANTADTIVVRDSGLTPSTTYNYSLYRIYQNQHWDSATAQVKTLDTTKDYYNWTVTKLGSPGSVLYCVWGASPNSVWAGGGVDSGNVVHYINGQFQYYDAGFGGVHSVYGTSDSNIWFGGGAAMAHWNGSGFTLYVFNGDSLPNVQQNFNAIWIAPDSELFAACDGGVIVHRKPNGQWETQPTPTTLTLTSIIGFAPNDVYAAGGYSNYTGVLLHYDGTGWTTVLQSVLPNSSVKVANMSVSGDSPDSLWIAGNGIYHSKGDTWEDRTPSQQQAYAENIYSAGWNNVLVCGDFGMIIKFDGSYWTAYHLVPSSGTILRRAIIISGEVFVVGDDDNTAYFIHGK